VRVVPFGRTGEHVSEMCLGTMMFGDRCEEAESHRILSAAVEQGATFIDTAAMYCAGLTEEIIGRWLKDRRRDEVFLATKVHKGIDAQSILSSIDESLARLQTDYVDLYLIHWPVEGMQPPRIMEALAQVVEQGKARFVGCCNYPAWLLAHSNAIAGENGWPRLVCNQVPYNLIERGVEVEILPQAHTEGIAITTYRPLVLGLFTGKYRPGEPFPAGSRADDDPRIEQWLNRFADAFTQFFAFAEARQIHPAQLAVAWLRGVSAVTSPIVGVSSFSQLQTSIDAFEVELSADDLRQLAGMFSPAEVQEIGGGRFPELRRIIDLTG